MYATDVGQVWDSLLQDVAQSTQLYCTRHPRCVFAQKDASQDSWPAKEYNGKPCLITKSGYIVKVPCSLEQWELVSFGGAVTHDHRKHKKNTSLAHWFSRIYLVKLARDLTRFPGPPNGRVVGEPCLKWPYFREIQVGEILFHLARFINFMLYWWILRGFFTGSRIPALINTI